MSAPRKIMFQGQLYRRAARKQLTAPPPELKHEVDAPLFPKPHETAADYYKRLEAGVERELQKLQQLIQRYRAERAKDPNPGWGYVGDLGHVYMKLRELTHPEE